MSVLNKHQSDSSASRLSLTSISLQRNRFWIGPLVTAIVILLVGWWANRSVENAVKTNLAGQLQALLDADLAALEIWVEDQLMAAGALANDHRIRAPLSELANVAANPEAVSVPADLLTSPALAQLRNSISPWLAKHHSQGFVVINRDLLVLAGDLDSGIGDPEIAKPYGEVLAPIFEGETAYVPPFKSSLLLPDIDGKQRAGVPVMFFCAPVRSPDNSVIASLCLRIRPEEQFSKILGVARAGESGETYAFDQQGVMITNSRFDENLKSIGLLTNDKQTRSLLNVEIRDPGVDMTRNKRPEKLRYQQPLTRMALAATSGENGVDVDGYRDYRGVPVIGAWHWLPEYRIGVATEVDVAEAFRPLYSLRRAFGVLIGLLFATALLNCWFAWQAARMERNARRAALTAKRLGQYSLDEVIGKGGMGVVYRAHHDMLRRPTAVKLLHVDRTNEQTTARFEREVQLTSQLTHPNTIAIYDYGRTPEGVFFYAMEYLEGITLEELVERFGPQPESRVIAIMRQVCGSLTEAHGCQLIHRDIKPANIMLTNRGGQSDFVKLLDFGLVKSQQADRNLTIAGSLTGTPMYLSPEAIQLQDLDPRSDLYALGAVAYFLLTGTPVFDSGSIVDICKKHISEDPQRPSERLGKPIDEDLENLILKCLAKQPEDRPDSAEDLEEEFANLASANQWNRVQARQWWDSHFSGNADSTGIDNVSLSETADGKPSTEIDLSATIQHTSGDFITTDPEGS